MTSPSEAPSTEPPADRLANFPVSFFAVVMGLAGLTIATHKLEVVLALGGFASTLLFWLTFAIYVVITAVFATKYVKRRDAALAEWAHPVRIAFFPAISIGLILLSVAGMETYPGFAQVLWTVGAALHFVFTVMVITAWINHSRYEVLHLNPAWFIPVVGNIIVPISGVHFAPVDISWFFFSFGLLFWLVLLSVVINRLIFHAPLPARLMPTLFILIAPPAVGFLSWTILNGGVDSFGKLLIFSADFFFILMLPQLGKFAKLPFALSWWATSFPLAALTLAQFTMGQKSGNSLYFGIGYVLYALLVLVIIMLAYKTITAMMRGEVCVPEK